MKTLQSEQNRRYFKALDAYRNGLDEHDIAECIINYLKIKVPSQAYSVFIYEQAFFELRLLYTSSKKTTNLNDKKFGPHSPVFSMFQDNEDRILSSEKVLKEYSNMDVSFEDVNDIHNIAFARIFDSRNTPIGILRVINKIDFKKNYADFKKKDLDELTISGNLLGAALSARHSNERIITFLDSVTHELLAPIAGVKNIAKFLQGYLSYKFDNDIENRKERIRYNIDNILKEAKQSILLVDNLTAFSRSRRMGKRDLNIENTLLHKDILIKVIRKLKDQFRKKHLSPSKVEAINWNRWPMVKVDRVAISQVFTNIITNSIKYSKKDPREFGLKIYHKENKIGNFYLYFEDNGIGIDPSAAAKIFLPGERGDNAIALLPTSTGIGLSTAKNLLALHECTISIVNYSAPTTVCIKFPYNVVVRRKK